MQVTIDHRNIPALLNKMTKMVSEFPVGALRISAMGISLDTSKLKAGWSTADIHCRRHAAVLVATVKDALVRPTENMPDGLIYKRASQWDVMAQPVLDIWAEKPFGLKWFQFPGAEVRRRDQNGANVMSMGRALAFLEASCIDGVCAGADWIRGHDGLAALAAHLGTNPTQRLAALTPEERVSLHRLEQALAGKPVERRVHPAQAQPAVAQKPAAEKQHTGPAPEGKTAKKKAREAAANAARRAAEAEAAKQGKATAATKDAKGKPAKGKGK